MNIEWSPGELAEYDQYLASANDVIDKMVAALKQGFREEDEPTVMAYMMATLIEQSDAKSVLGIAAVALRRIALEATSQPFT